MKASVIGEIRTIRPLPPRMGDDGKPKPPQCSVGVLVEGRIGEEIKTFKAPFSQMEELMKHVGEKIEFEIDVNEWDMNGKSGVSYTIWQDAK